MLGPVDDGLRGRALDDPPFLQDDDLVRDLAHDGERRRDEDDRRVHLVAQVVHQADDLGCDGDVELLGDVVGDKEGGVADQGVDDQRALHHAAGILEGELVEAALGRGMRTALSTSSVALRAAAAFDMSGWTARSFSTI